MSRNEKENYSTVLSAIQTHCSKMGMSFDTDARVETATQNLVRPLSQWPRILAELESGGGGEFKVHSGRRPKFNSVHSSAALCVNAFAPFNEHPGDMQLLGYGPFSVARFEMALNTGLSKPYLDFYLEDEEHVIGLESKFTEWLSPKVPDAITDSKSGVGNLTKYLRRAKDLAVLPDGYLERVIGHYVEIPDALHLDVAQLIKHTLGLLARSAAVGRKPVLVYLYWTPRNAADFAEHALHLEQITDFSKRIGPFIAFHALSYSDFWDELAGQPQYRETIPLLRDRYDIDC